MPELPQTKAKQVKSMGETPAQARERMASGGAVVEPPSRGVEVEGPLKPEHLAAIEQAEGGFRETVKVDGPPQDLDELAEPPSPSKAMEVIREQAQRVIQLQTELNAALNLVDDYRRKFGDLEQ